MDTNLFRNGYEIHPSKDKPDQKFFGLVSINNDYEIFVKEPEENYKSINSLYNRDDYYDWLNNYMKFYLLANLNNDELLEFHKSFVGRTLSKIDDLVNLVNTCSYYDIYKVIRKGVN